MILIFTLLSFLITQSVQANAIQEFERPLVQVFVPVGYDEDDSVNIIVEARLHNRCETVGTATSIVDEDLKKIEVGVTVFRHPGDSTKCPDFKNPLSIYRTFHLGTIHTPETYDIVDASSQKHLGHLVVEKVIDVSMGRDNRVYLPLRDAYLRKADKPDLQGNRWELVLEGVAAKGEFCPGSIDPRYQNNVIVILPGVAENSPTCPIGSPEAFSLSLRLDDSKVPYEPFLLHVRTFGGESINKIITPALYK